MVSHEGEPVNDVNGTNHNADDKDADESQETLLENGHSADEATNAIADDATPDAETEGNQGKIGFRDVINNVRYDSLYRQKFIHTCILWWSFVGLGWVVGINGPSFPDLRQIINEDLATASWMFPAGSLGYLVGSFVGGFLYDKFNKILLLAISTFLFGVSTIVTPFCAALPWMLFIRFAGGLTCGGLDVGGNADIIYVWGQDGNSYMQALHFGFSLGASISPYVTEPFLAKKIKTCSVSIVNSTNDPSISGLYTLATNEPNNSVPEFYDNNTTTEAIIAEKEACTEEYEASSVHIAFLIAGIIVLTSTVGYIYLYIQSQRNKVERKQARAEDKKRDEAKTNRKELTPCTKVIFLILLGILFATYCIVEDGFASFMMTFAIEKLKWDKSTGSFVTGLFWISFGVGRFMGIFIVACCRTSVLLTTYLITLGLSYVGFLLATIYNIYPLIWVFTVSLGVSMSVIFPAIFSWTSENIIKVTGKISAFFLTTASLAGMFCMFLIGNLMDKYDGMWFVYILVICMAICLVAYAVLSIAAGRIRSCPPSDKEDTIIANGDQDNCTETTLMKSNDC